MKFFKSLAFKNAIFYLVIFLIGLGIMGYLLLQNSSKRIVQNAEIQLIHSGDLIEIQIREYVDELMADLLFLSDSPVLKKYLKDKSEENYALLNSEFLSLISSNNDYAQIRYLESTMGKEVVRVEQMNGKSIVTPRAQLQIKKNRPYFTNTIQLDSMDIYFSSIDLNREFGAISMPHTPTLRIAKPIYINSTLQGIIVINTNLTKLFDKLNKSVGNGYALRIYNKEGYYLLHESKDSVFLFEFGRDRPQVDTQRKMDNEGVISNQNELLSNHKMTIAEMDYPIYFNIVADKYKLLKPYYEWRDRSIFLIFLIAFVFTGLAFWKLRRQSKTLQRLTANIKDFPSKRMVSALPKSRNDEIGDLARSFEEMVSIINNQMNAIETEKLKAQAAERDKSYFIENISHEIRNPLQSIIGLSTMLEQNNPNSNQIDILKSIKLNTSNLNALVNSILDYQNLRSGSAKVKYQYTDVSRLIQKLITGMGPVASQKMIQIDTIIDAALESIEVQIDTLRISQILNNLITNAIANTAANGHIDMEVKLIKNVDEDATIRFSVLDNGAGMTAEEVARIKERYYSKTEARVVDTNYGLGLTIVNELLDMMGAELIIDSEKNKGSVFSFVINGNSRVKIVEEFKERNFKSIVGSKKVLIIEDDEQIVRLYKHYFEDIKTTFLTGFDQLPELNAQTFDLIISDYYVQRRKLMDHIEIIKKCASMDTSLIVISGKMLNLQRIETFFPGAVYAQKPLSKSLIFQKILAGMVFTKFGKPNLETIKEDYDYDKAKYQKAFLLLINEWKTYHTRLMNSVRNRNADEFEEVLHKLNNTLRKLQLSRFEEYLFRWKDFLGDEQFDVENTRVEMSDAMNVFYEYIKSNLHQE